MRKTLFRDDEFGYLEYEVSFGVPWVHSEIYYWTPSAYKEYKGIWKAAKEILKSEGFSEVFVAIPDNDPKLLKFEKMFGFNIVHSKEGAIILKQEL